MSELAPCTVGPLYVKYGSVRKPTVLKSYVCVFVSLSVKAVHLELVSNLTLLSGVSWHALAIHPWYGVIMVPTFVGLIESSENSQNSLKNSAHKVKYPSFVLSCGSSSLNVPLILADYGRQLLKALSFISKELQVMSSSQRWPHYWHSLLKQSAFNSTYFRPWWNRDPYSRALPNRSPIDGFTWPCLFISSHFITTTLAFMPTNSLSLLAEVVKWVSVEYLSTLNKYTKCTRNVGDYLVISYIARRYPWKMAYGTCCTSVPWKGRFSSCRHCQDATTNYENRCIIADRELTVLMNNYLILSGLGRRYVKDGNGHVYSKFSVHYVLLMWYDL